MQKYLVGAKPARQANIEVHINRKLATDQTIVCVFAILLENGEKYTVKEDHYYLHGMGQWYKRELSNFDSETFLLLNGC